MSGFDGGIALVICSLN